MIFGMKLDAKMDFGYNQGSTLVRSTFIPAGMVVCRSFHDLLQAGVLGCRQLHVRQGQQLLQVNGLGEGQAALHSLLQPPISQLSPQHSHHGGLVGQQVVITHLGPCNTSGAPL